MPDFATRKAAKFWVGLAGLIPAAVIAVTPDVPSGWYIATTLATAIGVYLVPNEEAE